MYKYQLWAYGFFSPSSWFVSLRFLYCPHLKNMLTGSNPACALGLLWAQVFWNQHKKPLAWNLFSLRIFPSQCFVMISPLCRFDWPRICSKSSVQNGAFDTLVLESTYALHRAIVASLYHGCSAVAKRYMCSFVWRGQQGFALQDNIQKEKSQAYCRGTMTCFDTVNE